LRTVELREGFIPAPLAVGFEITQELFRPLMEAREAVARLDGAGRFLPAGQLLVRPLQQREAIRSSSLEGTYATPEELLAYELEPKEPTSSEDPVNTWREVFNYDRALRQGQDLLNELPISNRLIRMLHETLLTGVRGKDRTPGVFRKRQVHVGSDRRFVPPPPEDVENLMGDLEGYINLDTQTDPLIKAFLAHYQFETIHPFLDGNGRVGRLILTLMIFNGCALKQPWLYLSAYFDRYKDEYIDALFRVSTEGNWLNWIKLCLRATASEANDAMARIDALVILKTEYEAKIATASLPARLMQIVLALFDFPMISVPIVVKKCNVTFPTAKKDVERLMELGILSPSSLRGSPQNYIASQIFKIAYTDTI